MPVAGRDYPRTWGQFLDWFPDDDSCRRYLERIRWKQGFVCPGCGVADVAFQGTRGRWICRHCRRQSTVTAGTVFDKTRTPLRSWLAAVWHLLNQKQGVNALGLQRVLGLGSYQTAWAMLHRLRRAMIRPGRERLHGLVEVDECWVGPSPPKALRLTKKKQQLIRKRRAQSKIVMVAVEIKEPTGFGGSACNASPINPRKPSCRSCWMPLNRVNGAYRRLSGLPQLEKRGYRREMTVMLGAKDPAHVTMPGVHRVAALLKRWLLGTHQGAVRPAQLDYYLDEFTFRFNRRTSRSRGLLFYRMLEQALVTDPVTYAQITRKAKHNI